jgi:DNA/RNA endonuclease YhcR with UshA esterase domain
VEITGRITEYIGKPGIILHSLNQIKIIEKVKK